MRQSLADILNTPLGTRVMRPWYGSRLPDLVDAPMNRQTIADIRAATADAIAAKNPSTGTRVEPRFNVTKVTVASAAPGQVELDLEGDYLPDGQAVTISGIVVG